MSLATTTARDVGEGLLRLLFLHLLFATARRANGFAGLHDLVSRTRVIETALVRGRLGLDDEGVLELMAVVDLFSGFNKLMDGLQVEPDEKLWYG